MLARTDYAIRGQFARFAMVGVLGFMVDATVLYLCLHGLGFDFYSGRLVSYLFAATTTWYLNRKLTFIGCDSTAPGHQWARFVATNGIGGLVNYGSYSLVVALLPAHLFVPLIGVAVGSIAGLGFNFAASRLFVFKPGMPKTAQQPIRTRQ
ncbi:GtrA family protein [Thiobacillus sp.]